MRILRDEEMLMVRYEVDTTNVNDADRDRDLDRDLDRDSDVKKVFQSF